MGTIRKNLSNFWVEPTTIKDEDLSSSIAYAGLPDGVIEQEENAVLV
jgi:hypothetical protein